MTWHSIAPTLVLSAAPLANPRTVDLTLDHLGNPTGLPAARVLALVTATLGTANAIGVSVQPDDDPTDWLTLSYTDGQGTSFCVPDGTGLGVTNYQAMLTPTGPTGRIVLKDDLVGLPETRSLYLLGWADWTDTAAPGGTTVFGPGALPVAPPAWPDLDLSATIGAVDAWVFFREQWTAGGSDRYGMRRDGDTEDYSTPFAVAGMPLGAAQLGSFADATRRRGLCVTADAGVVEHEAAAAQNGQLDLLGYATATVVNAEVFAAAAGPIAWGTTLDLTVDTGAAPTGLVGESLVQLRFTLRAGGGNQQRAAVRRNGDVLDYGLPWAGGWSSFQWPEGVALGCVSVNDQSIELICSTDPAGLIEWLGDVGLGGTWQIELISFVGSVAPPVPPVVAGTGPVGAAVSPGASVTFTTTDDVQVVEATIQLVLQDPTGASLIAILAGVIQAGWSGTITANGSNGFDVSVTKDGGMAEGIWTATAYCEDAGAASDSDTWVWYVHSGAFRPWEPVT